MVDPSERRAGRGGRRPGSARWLEEHRRDPYVRAAREAGYRSRAAYKLLEMAATYRLIVPGSTVVDLGAAPGGWSQVASAMAGPRGRVVAVDRLPMAELSSAGSAPVICIQGDFLAAATVERVRQEVGGGTSLILSDLAPNLSGIAVLDQAAGAELAMSVLEFAPKVLQRGGRILLKLFQGRDQPEVLAGFRAVFSSIQWVKPQASRDRSPEVYLLAEGWSPQPEPEVAT